VQRKVFRIEQMIGHRRASLPPVAPRPTPEPVDGAAEAQALRRELAHIRDAIGNSVRALAALLAEGKERRMPRAAGELGAAVDVMEKSAETILHAAEVIDENAKGLAAAQKSDYERGLAQEIQEHVVRLYEACNFQDLAGQRIGKVIATLDAVEAQVSSVIERCTGLGIASEAPPSPPVTKLLNGPKLDGDAGHASQGDIDALFA
jgi:chemotaxis protein CheZ